MTEKSKNEINGILDLIKALFKDGNWYLGGFIIALILFIIFDIIAFTPH
ncbi:MULTISPECIES: hypothetical protein [Metallosphaera]|nr:MULTISPECIES: hypothetical protein [Metallosphaera]MCH1771749.1 hypothetical protein [Metallosphaera sedula]MCP6728347.1 hypothetical protein [Metallosphaera sedula]MCY0861740.1 hypothetical protein [Metallosphaera prunae]WPX06947.1 hypothetical protein SOJ17_000681 [Metallosphaera sedula DSM 5348]BBL46762.1 hypothetical protein MJ1HA_0861 [Metallosphaera sedula]